MRGHQLTADELHARQQSQHTDLLAPVMVAAGVSDAENIGAILRIADAVRCREVLFVDVEHADSARIQKVSRNTGRRVAHRFIDFEAFRAIVPDLPGALVAVEITSQSTDLYATDLPREVTFVIGSERYGIPAPVLELCATAVHIPMFGVNSAMNVAVSLGVVLYEWHRRFRHSDIDS